MFDYYYGNQADQFSFIRIPRMMLTDALFEHLSIQAKLLYSIFLDRLSLSMKNGWLDEENKAYIIYQITEIQTDLGFSKKKSMDYLNELESFGLIEKKKRGFGLPNIIYVKNFMINQNKDRGIDLGTSGEKEGGSRSIDLGTPEVSIWEPLEVPKSVPLNNKTNNNYIKYNHILSNHISAENDNDVMRCEQKIKQQIDYESLIITHGMDEEIISGIINLMMEIDLSQSQNILIASENYPAQMVKERFSKIRYSHVEYVLMCFDENKSKIKNIKKYILAMLFNSVSTKDGYYMAAVNHDMATNF